MDPLGGTEAAPEITSALDRLRGAGARLPGDLAHSLGAAMSTDFGNVSIHTGPDAHNLTRALQARAFTHGSDIYFSAGSYAPGTASGRHLLTHELAHVAQAQSATPAGSGLLIGRADDRAEVEAEATALRVARSPDLLRRTMTRPPAAVRRKPAAGVVRRAGDKIAFEAKTSDDADDQVLIKQIGRAISDHQRHKKSYKDSIELKKDLAIKEASKAEDRAVGKIEKGLENKEYRERRDQVQAPFKDQRIETLKVFHEDYQKSGWNLVRLSQEILDATGAKVEIRAKVGDEIPVHSVATGAKLYSILSGAGRFGAAVNQEMGVQLANPVYGKKGTNKQYVQDQRGLFVGRYVYRGCSPEQMKELYTTGVMRPRNPTDDIGGQIGKFDFGARTASGKITQAEREYLQQRDGSGDDQRMLSVTHAKPGRKVHSNHGEEFTDCCVIRIDLAKIARNLIYDVHLVESHQYKTSLKRKDMNKSAQEELVLYVYSAEKNRETLLSSIPVDAVDMIQVPGWPEVMNPYRAKRFYNKEFDKQELERERLAREKEALEKRQQEEQEKKRSTQDATSQRYDKIVEELKKQAARNAKKLKNHTQALDKLWDDPASYIEQYETKKKKSPLNPSLVMFSDLEELIKLAK